jgi:hypothetical protein
VHEDQSPLKENAADVADVQAKILKGSSIVRLEHYSQKRRDREYLRVERVYFEGGQNLDLTPTTSRY